MTDYDLTSLMKAAAERQLAVTALQKKYEESVPMEQIISDVLDLLASERVILDAIITLFIRLDHDHQGETADQQTALS